MQDVEHQETLAKKKSDTPLSKEAMLPYIPVTNEMLNIEKLQPRKEFESKVSNTAYKKCTNM